MMRIADVSVVVANYNNSRYLKQFFDSIKASSLYPGEIVFVDDCSTDNSLELIRTFDIPNLIVIELDKNVGFSNALNIGVEKAGCKYILRIDPDDLMDPERIREQVEFLESNPEIDIMGSNCRYFNEAAGKYVGSSNVSLRHDDIVRRYMTGDHGMIHGTIMCKSRILKNYKYRQENYPAEEYDIFSRMILGGCRFHNLEKPLLTYRMHLKSVSNKMPYSTVKKISELNSLYFKKKYSSFKTFRNFLFLRNYRNYLEGTNVLIKAFFLFICIAVRPENLINRFYPGK